MACCHSSASAKRHMLRLPSAIMLVLKGGMMKSLMSPGRSWWEVDKKWRKLPAPLTTDLRAFPDAMAKGGLRGPLPDKECKHEGRYGGQMRSQASMRGSQTFMFPPKRRPWLLPASATVSVALGARSKVSRSFWGRYRELVVGVISEISPLLTSPRREPPFPFYLRVDPS